MCCKLPSLVVPTCKMLNLDDDVDDGCDDDDDCCDDHWSYISAQWPPRAQCSTWTSPSPRWPLPPTLRSQASSRPDYLDYIDDHDGDDDDGDDLPALITPRSCFPSCRSCSERSCCSGRIVFFFGSARINCSWGIVLETIVAKLSRFEVVCLACSQRLFCYSVLIVKKIDDLVWHIFVLLPKYMR